MAHGSFLRLVMGAVLVLFFLPADPAFSFLYVGKGDALPSLEFTEFTTDARKEFHTGQRPLILVFWGADLDTKKERAIEVLSDIQQKRAFYGERNVELAAVFVQPQLVSLIDEVVDQAHIDFPVYVDTKNQAFAKLGVYVMPSILIVSEDGIIHEELGYNHNLDEVLPGEVQVMLNEKTREELNAQLHPEIVERTTAQRRARLDYNYAVNLVQRHRIDAALEKLDLALANNSEFIPALVEKGCLLIKKKKFQEAEEFLDRGLELVPEFERALTCKAKLESAEKLKEQEGEAPVRRSDPASWGFFADDEEDGEEDFSE